MKTVLILAACLMVVPVFAAQPSTAAAANAQLTAPQATPASDDSPAASCSLDALPEPLFLSTTSTCTAQCWDGSTVTCGGSSCQAVDSACPSQRGWCLDGSGDFTNCPACPPVVCPSPSCDDLDGQLCKPHQNTCYMPIGGICHAYTCICSNGHLICP